MRRRNIVVIIVIALLVVASGFAAYVTAPSWYPKGTTVTISPSSGTIQSGTKEAFTATVKFGSTVISGGTITWSVSSGSLDKTTGYTVVFSAPSVTSSESVTITASFSGKEVYQASSASVHLTVSSGTTSNSTTTTTTTSGTGISSTTTTTTTSLGVLPYLYTMTFQSATMTNVEFTGPITMNGTSVTLIEADVANLTGFTVNRINLNASTIGIANVEWFVTSANFQSSNPSNAIQITGGQSVSIGPIASVTYESGNMSVVQWNGASAELTGMTTQGQPSNGSVPYIPNILTASEADLTDDYEIQGPVSWGSLANATSSIIVGEITISQFSFIHPSSYTQDAQTRTVNYTGLWLLTATGVTGTNVTAYTIYFDVSGFNGLETAIGFGTDNMHNIIPHGYTSGSQFPVTSISVHTVEFSVHQISLSSFVLSIE